MTEQVTFQVMEMNSPAKELEVINAMKKYSGVLQVDTDLNSSQVKVRFEPYNILAEDLKRSVEAAGYRVAILKS